MIWVYSFFIYMTLCNVITTVGHKTKKQMFYKSFSLVNPTDTAWVLEYKALQMSGSCV